MAFIVKNDLSNFLDKVKQSDFNGITEKVCKCLKQKGEKIMEGKYKAHNHSHIKVTSEIVDNKVILKASGKGVSFFEFGTGINASGIYPVEKLPKTGVPITGSWQYYYPSPAKVTVDGKQGWYLNKSFVTGKLPEMEVFETAKEIRNYIKTDLKDDIMRKG